MAKEEFYKEITLDSANFRTGSINRPTFYFDSFMDDFDYVIPSRLIIPTTYYVFSSPAYVSCTINGTAVSWAAGNYTPSEWIAIVQPQVAGLTITYSTVTNKLTFAAGSTVTVSFTSTQRAWELLGFNAGSNTNGTSTLTTPNVIQFSGPNYLVLHSRLASVFNNNSIYFSKNLTGATQEDNFIIVPVDVNRNSVIFYTAIPQRFFEWFDSSTKSLEFYFTLGQRTEVVDFNGGTFQIKLSGYSYDNGMQTKRANRNVRALER